MRLNNEFVFPDPETPIKLRTIFNPLKVTYWNFL